MDKDLRFCCVNMVILDSVANDDVALVHSRKAMIPAMEQTDDWIKKCRNIIQKTKQERFKWNVEDQAYSKYFGRFLNLYSVVRLLFTHCFHPIFIMVYVGISSKWNFAEINFMIVGLGFIVLFLYFCCIICGIHIFGFRHIIIDI